MRGAGARFAVLICTVFLNGRAIAQAAAAEPPEAQPPEVKVFNVRDLLVDHPDYPRDGTVVPPTKIGEKPPTGVQQSGVQQSYGPVQTRTEHIDAIIKLLEESIAPDSWRDNGGQVGMIRFLDGQFIVTQTRTNLLAVEKLLGDLRANRNRTLSLAAHWVLLQPGELEHVTKVEQQARERQSTLRYVDLTAIGKLASAPPHFIAQTLCLDGQQISVTGGRVKTVVQDLEPVVGNGVAAYQPTTSPVQAGVSLEVTATLAPDATAVLNIISIYSEWGSLKRTRPQPTTSPAPFAPPGGIDRIDMPMSQIKTSVNIPIGKAVVIGAATLEPSTNSKAGDIRQLYLIVEVNVDEKN